MGILTLVAALGLGAACTDPTLPAPVTPDRPIAVAPTSFLIAQEPVAEVKKPPYPETRRDDLVEMLHGIRVEDPYRWLEDAAQP